MEHGLTSRPVLVIPGLQSSLVTRTNRECMIRPRYDSGQGVYGRRPEFAFCGVVLAGRQVAGQHREHLAAVDQGAAEAKDGHLLLLCSGLMQFE